MNIKEKKLKIKNLKAFYMDDWDLTEEQKDQLDALATDILNVGIEQGKLESSANREGYKLAPIEPTQKMISAGMGVFSFPLDNGRFSDCELIFSYREMIGAIDE